jgi:hypothetical protein
MGFVLTGNGRLTCIHGGQVVLTPRQPKVTIQGGAVMRETDLIGAPIVGCAQPPSAGSKPCTVVVSVMPGGSAPKVACGGLPVHVNTLIGMTDGVPPGTVSVLSAGQATVQA